MIKEYVYITLAIINILSYIFVYIVEVFIINDIIKKEKQIKNLHITKKEPEVSLRVIYIE